MCIFVDEIRTSNLLIFCSLLPRSLPQPPACIASHSIFSLNFSCLLVEFSMALNCLVTNSVSSLPNSLLLPLPKTHTIPSYSLSTPILHVSFMLCYFSLLSALSAPLAPSCLLFLSYTLRPRTFGPFSVLSFYYFCCTNYLWASHLQWAYNMPIILKHEGQRTQT
jgi:hypothetical protein